MRRFRPIHNPFASVPLFNPWILLLLSLLALTASAQDALRMSLASEEAAQARNQAAMTPGYYNLMLGPTSWRFGANLQVDYNSDVIYREPAVGDFIFSPEIDARMLWPLTLQNSLNLTLGAGYSFYASQSQLDHFFITPNSELSFDIYTGDFWINLHDRFSINENTYQDPTLAGVGNYSRLDNSLGVSATWDLNKVIVRSGYDHVNYITLTGGQNQPDGQSELFTGSAGYQFKPELQLGVELGGGLVSYSSAGAVSSLSSYLDATQGNAGAYGDAQVGEYAHFRGSVGYTFFTPQPVGGGGSLANQVNQANSAGSGIYAQLEFKHRLNQYVDYVLSGGRNISFTFYGGAYDLYQAQLAANWHLFQKADLNTTLIYNHGTQIAGASETFDQSGVSIGLSRPITRHLDGKVGYQLYIRTSNLPDRSYTANILSLSLTYTF
jgi:hypothetical protein